MSFPGLATCTRQAGIEQALTLRAPARGLYSCLTRTPARPMARRSPMHDTPQSPAALFRTTCECLRRHDARANALLPALQAYPEYTAGWLQLARTLRALGQADAALVAFDQALVSGDAIPNTALDKADLLCAENRPGAAIPGLITARQRWPGDVRIPHRLGRAYYATGDLDNAAATLQMAVAQAPDFAEAWFHLGLVIQDLGRPGDAADAYRAALRAQPRMCEAALNLGVSLQDTGAIEPAMDAYARAVRIRPAIFNRVAQALTSAPTGRLWLDLSALRRALDARA